MTLTEAYLQEDPRIRPFYAHDWREPDWQEILRQRAQHPPINREILISVLQKQYHFLDQKAEATRNLERLADPKAVCITTGQQPALFGGPMYNLYKAITTIRTARKAEAILKVPVIPIFWVAGEDHDREELDHTSIDFIHTLRYTDLSVGPVGRQIINESINELEIQNGLIGGPMRKHWQAGTRWELAFVKGLHELFGECGMLFLNADDAQLKQTATKLWRRELFDRASFRPIESQSAALKAAGFRQQLHQREINLFWLEEGFRERIEAVGGGFQTADGSRSWTDQEMEQALAEQPECISPNAALRPVYQETILPNLAYVGGWGEIAYWLQLKSAFQALGAFYPLLLPRMRARIWTQKQEKERKRLKLNATDVEKNEAHIREIFARRLRPEKLPEGWGEKLNAHWIELEDWVIGEAPEYIASLRSMRNKNEKYEKQLSWRLDRKALHEQPNDYLAALQLKREIEPEGKVQERSLNLMAWPEKDVHKLIKKLISEDNLQDWELRDCIL